MKCYLTLDNVIMPKVRIWAEGDDESYLILSMYGDGEVYIYDSVMEEVGQVEL